MESLLWFFVIGSNQIHSENSKRPPFKGLHLTAIIITDLFIVDNLR